MDIRIEFEWRENEAYRGGKQFLVVVTDAATGSSTSFEAENWPTGVEKALSWAGIDGVEIYFR